jgi:hypothetical protein
VRAHNNPQCPCTHAPPAALTHTLVDVERRGTTVGARGPPGPAAALAVGAGPPVDADGAAGPLSDRTALDPTVVVSPALDAGAGSAPGPAAAPATTTTAGGGGGRTTNGAAGAAATAATSPTAPANAIGNAFAAGAGGPGAGTAGAGGACAIGAGITGSGSPSPSAGSGSAGLGARAAPPRALACDTRCSGGSRTPAGARPRAAASAASRCAASELPPRGRDGTELSTPLLVSLCSRSLPGPPADAPPVPAPPDRGAPSGCGFPATVRGSGFLGAAACLGAMAGVVVGGGRSAMRAEIRCGDFRLHRAESPVASNRTCQFPLHH